MKVKLIIIGAADRGALCKNKVWKDQMGEYLYIPEMSREHCINAYAFLARNSAMDCLDRAYMQHFHQRIMEA